MYRVYKIIVSNDAHTVYIGCTKYSLNRRFNNHKTEAKWERSKKDKWIMNNYNYMSIVEEGVKMSKSEAIQLEDDSVRKYLLLGYDVINEVYPLSRKRIRYIPLVC
jgi:predicted GIY-YIG superfamily endonuclease